MSITYSSDNPCAQTTTVEVEIGSVPDAAIDDQSFCEGTGEVVMVPVTNGGSWTAECTGCCTTDGVFDTQSAGTGAWDLTYTITGTCPATGTATFTVTPNTSSAFALIPEYCLDHDPAVAAPEEVGGNWTASCTNCISSTGQFSPATAGAGVHTVSYTIPGACGTSTDATVTVHGLPEADFTYSPAEGCAPAVVACTAPRQSEHCGLPMDVQLQRRGGFYGLRRQHVCH